MRGFLFSHISVRTKGNRFLTGSCVTEVRSTRNGSSEHRIVFLSLPTPTNPNPVSFPFPLMRCRWYFLLPLRIHYLFGEKFSLGFRVTFTLNNAEAQWPLEWQQQNIPDPEWCLTQLFRRNLNCGKKIYTTVYDPQSCPTWVNKWI